MYTCNSSAKRKAFRALVLPVLDYAITVWNPHTQKNISALEKIQNRGLAGCVAAGTTVIVSHGQSHLVNVVTSFTGHLFLLIGSILQ